MKSDTREPSNSRLTLVKVGRRTVVRIARRLTSRPAGTPHAQQKYWQELLGQVGGPVRRPLLPLQAGDLASIRKAFDASGLHAGNLASASSA
jgi:hypothetical protein